MSTPSSGQRTGRAGTLRPVPVAGRERRSPALERRTATAGATSRPPATNPSRRRRARRRPASSRRPLLLLVALLFFVVLGWRWWAGRAGPPAPAAPPQIAAGAPAAPPVANAPAVATLPGGGLLENALPALPGERPDPALQAIVDAAIDRDNGTAGVLVRQLSTGATAAYHDKDTFRSASVAKVPILVETYRQLAAGTLRADEQLQITEENITDGSGVLQARAGDRLSVAELLRLSVSVSDNTAARMLLQRAGGEAAVNRTMAALGLSQTRLYADDRPNTTSAAEMATLLSWIATRSSPFDTRPAVAGGGPGPDTLASLLALSQAQAWLTDDLPRGVPVAHKSGQLPGVRNEAGVIYGPGGPYVVVVLTDELADQGDAEAFIADLGRAVYDYFSRR
jgi:beta-lactamase class A